MTCRLQGSLAARRSGSDATGQGRTTAKTSCEITGLTRGVARTFGATARNAIGFSRPAMSDRVMVFSADT
jgi:ribosomal protein S14